MKNKPNILIITSVLLFGGLSVWTACKSNKALKTDEIMRFLDHFDSQVKSENADSVLSSFDADKRNPGLMKLVNLLAGKSGLNSKEKPLSKVLLDIYHAEIKQNDNQLVLVNLPVRLQYNNILDAKSILYLKIQRNDQKQLKIVQVDAKAFLTDFIAAENLIKSKTVKDEDIYSPITLKSFEVANSLKSKYDSVVWFSHLKNQTYYYVVKGKWSNYNFMEKDSVIKYKMGLLGPDLKEIIPPGFDLIHNIGGTFENLVEVEKDHKRGFYNMEGKAVVPVIYDAIFPLKDDVNMAALQIGKDFYWLKNDFTISDKTDLKIANILPKLAQPGSFTMSNISPDNITEVNSKDVHGAVYVTPSYLVDLNLVAPIKYFKNPLRHNIEYDEISTSYVVKEQEKSSGDDNWFQSMFYKIRDYYLGGRSEFYDSKNLLVIDNKNNRILSTTINTDYNEEGFESLDGICDINNIKALNDSLFEVKSGANIWVELYDTTKTVIGGPYYHYIAIKNNKLVELPGRRNFGFTKFIKMDDNYLNGCYVVGLGNDFYQTKKTQTLNRITPEMLSYMKNEIYADYRYHFKDKRWRNVFQMLTSDYDDNPDMPAANTSVDDSLTAIDKYNINFITQKLKVLKKPVLAAAK